MKNSRQNDRIKNHSKRSNIQPFIVMDIMQEAGEMEKSGRQVIHMEVGQPSTPAPKTALLEAQKAILNDKLGYTDALGLPELRERISKFYKDQYDLYVRPERIIVTTGSSAAFNLAFMAFFDSGAKIAITNPGYPCYRQILNSLGLVPVDISLSAEKRWMPHENSITEAINSDNIEGIILASPANPTGTMLLDKTLEALIESAVSNDLCFISDEIYHGLYYDRQTKSALQFSDDVIVINSFSKYFSMTGWRIGWMVVPEQSVRVIERLAQNFFISSPTISQFAAIGAFEGQDELEGHKATYAKNREILLNELGSSGLKDILPADGAFYLYADVSKYTNDSLDFAKKMLNDIGVAITPGRDFDPVNGHQFVRFSYAASTKEIMVGTERIKNWMKTKSI